MALECLPNSVAHMTSILSVKTWSFSRAYHIESLTLNLLSSARMNEFGITITFYNWNYVGTHWRWNGEGCEILYTVLLDGLFAAKIIPPLYRATIASGIKRCDRIQVQKAHKRNAEALSNLRMRHSKKSAIKQSSFRGRYVMKRLDRAESCYCASCAIARQCKAPTIGKVVVHSHSNTTHADVTGPMPAESFADEALLSDHDNRTTSLCEDRLLEYKSRCPFEYSWLHSLDRHMCKTLHNMDTLR